MKNHLKFILTVTTVSLLSTGCKKEATVVKTTESDNYGSSIENRVSAVKTPNLFRAAKDNTQILVLNAPLKAQQLVGIMDIGNNTTTKVKALNPPSTAASAKIPYTHKEILLWSFVVAPATNEIAIEPSDAPYKTPSNEESIRKGGSIVDFRKHQTQTTLKNAKTEIFAVNRQLKPEELNNLETMTREEFKTYCRDIKNELYIVGSTVVYSKDKVIFDLERELIKLETMLFKAENRQQDTNLSNRNRAMVDFDISTIKQTTADYQSMLNKLRSKTEKKPII